MATIDNNHKFLSYTGLEKFWALIKTKFASNLDVTVTNETGAVFQLKDANGSNIGTQGNIPMATSSQPGLMSKEQAAIVDTFEDGVDNLIPFIGMQINNEDVKLTARKANIGLDLVKEGTGDSAKQYIVLKDIAATSANANAISKIDVTEFVINGLLEDTDLVVQNGKTYIKLVWNLANGTTKTELIDVTTLIDVYTGGNGVNVTNNQINLVFDPENSDTNGNAYLTAGTTGITLTEDFWKEVDRMDKETSYTKKEVDDKLDELNEALNTDLADEIKKLKEETVPAAKEDAINISNAYTDQEIKKAVGNYTAEGVNPSGIRKEIEEAESRAKGYTDSEISKLDGKLTGDITTAINGLDVEDTANAGYFVTAVSQTDGKISVTRDQINIDQVLNWTTITNDEITAIVG